MKYGLLLLAGVVTFSCAKDPAADSNVPESRYLEELTVYRTALALSGAEEEESLFDTGNGIAPNPGTDPEPPKYNGEEVFDPDFIPGNIIYVSQRTTSAFPFAKNDAGEPINPIYVYENYTSTANWMEGYNFKPQPKPDAPLANSLDWEDVRSRRSVGNGFVLCAMYYPGNGAEGTRAVPKDQRSMTNLLRADIQAAYHSTSALYSRVRFKLFHLMTYFKINLYVPVFAETAKEGEDKLYSGYTPESLINAWVENACPEFLINWASNISSDTRPDVDIVNAEHKENIYMYSHGHLGDNNNTGGDDNNPDNPDTPDNPDDGGDSTGSGEGENRSFAGRTRTDEQPDEPEEPGSSYVDPGETIPDDSKDLTIRPLKQLTIDVKKFLPGALVNIQPLPTEKDGSMPDDVYLYSFSVIIPAQPASFTDQFPGWLHFQFKDPSEATKNYYFNSQFVQDGSLKTTSGTLQVLNLYLPRKGDEVILINADVKPWTEVETDMNLQQQEKEDKK